MLNKEFMEILESKGYSCKYENNVITVIDQGPVLLRSVTTLPEGIQFNNQGYVFLGSINGDVVYRGKTITLRNIDGYTMLVTSSKTVGNITISKARYFGGGDIKDLKKSYVASQGEFHAHGKSRDDALSSLAFKVESETRNKEDVRNDVVRSGVVRILDYRLLTGACKEGVEHHLRERGIDFKKVDSIPVEDALKASKGGYGHDEFVRQINIARKEVA